MSLTEIWHYHRPALAKDVVDALVKGYEFTVANPSAVTRNRMVPDSADKVLLV